MKTKLTTDTKTLEHFQFPANTDPLQKLTDAVKAAGLYAHLLSGVTFSRIDGKTSAFHSRDGRHTMEVGEEGWITVTKEWRGTRTKSTYKPEDLATAAKFFILSGTDVMEWVTGKVDAPAVCEVEFNAPGADGSDFLL